jgi:hypothetical protein
MPKKTHNKKAKGGDKEKGGSGTNSFEERQGWGNYL